MALELKTSSPEYELDDDGNPKKLEDGTLVVKEPEKIEVFSIDEVAYYIPKTVRRGLSLKYLKMKREQGSSVAIAFLLEEVLGTETYDILSDYDELTDDDLAKVTKLVMSVVMGGLEGPKG